MGVFYNGTAAIQTVTTSGSEISQFDPGMLAMNAGPNDEYAMVQFTAPVNGIYTFQGVFEGIDTAGTVSSVYPFEEQCYGSQWQRSWFWAGKRCPAFVRAVSARCGRHTDLRCGRPYWQ